MTLPIDLPEGWTASPLGEGDVVIITAADPRCSVSVSPKWRSYSLGAGMPRRSALGMVCFSGRNWRAALFTAAVESLTRHLPELAALYDEPPPATRKKEKDDTND